MVVERCIVVGGLAWAVRRAGGCSRRMVGRLEAAAF